MTTAFQSGSFQDDSFQIDAAGGGTNVTPGVVALSLTGFAPSVTAPADVSPTAATLTLTGYAPTIGVSVNVTPSVANLVLTGFAPSVTAPAAVTPSAVALTLTGFAPSVTAPAAVTPSAGSLTLLGFAPTVDVASSGGVSLTPGAATLTLTGYAPDVVGDATKVAGGGGSGKKYYAKVGKKLLVFKTRQGAIDALDSEEDEPEVEISLPAVKAYAKVTGQIEDYNAAYRSEQYAKLLAMFEQMRYDEDVELLMLS